MFRCWPKIISMGMVGWKKSNCPEPYKVETLNKKILVIGGGITGISAAMTRPKPVTM